MSTIGIYKITNKINGKAYIGQSIDIERRICEHKRVAFEKNSSSYNYHLYKAMRYYGIENFSFEIIEICTKEKLNEKEIFWIKYYDSFFNGYNLTMGGNQTSVVPKQKIIETINDLKNTNLSFKDISLKRDISIRMIYEINSGKCWKQDIEYPIRKKLGRNYESKNHTIDSYNKKHNNKCSICGSKISPEAKLCIKCYKENINNKPINKKKPKSTNKQNLKNENANKYCMICNKPISRNTKKICLDCFKKEQAKNIPTKEQLIDDLLTSSMIQIGKKYNVSDNAVRKWCKKYELPYKRKDIIEFRNNYNKKGDC